MKKVVSLLILLITFHFLQSQQTTIVLDGKIDKYPIIMQIDIYDDTACDVKYYYLNQLKDIYLDGSIDKKGNVTANTEERGDETKPKEQFQLTKTPTGYTGLWTKDKKKLAVNLQKITIGKYKNQYDYLQLVKELKEKDQYDYIRTANFQFALDSNSLNNNVELSWHHEKYTGIVMPRLDSGYSNAVLQKINTTLLEKHLIESVNSLQCIAAPWGEYYLTAQYIFSNQNILSFNIAVGYYCGGAHPDFDFQGLSFNTQTGELLNLDNVFWPGKNKPPDTQSDKWYDYRDNVFAKKVVEIFKQLYPDQMKTPAEDDEEICDYSDPEVWNFVNWYFNEKGLYLGAYFGRVARSCDSPEWSVIPYKILKNYLNPGLNIKFPD